MGFVHVFGQDGEIRLSAGEDILQSAKTFRCHGSARIPPAEDLGEAYLFGTREGYGKG